MGVAAADYDGDGWLDIVKTNFSGEAPNLYHNSGNGAFDNVTGNAGVGMHDNYVGWGCGFFDPDNDGRPDIFYCNGHVYPELDQIHGDLQYREPRVLYRNMGNGRFEDVSRLAGSCVTTPAKGRGSAFGDFNNDGCTDIVVNNHNSTPSLIRCDRMNHNHWITIKVEGVKSNRSGIGTRLKCVAGNLKQIDEVRSGGSYLSQNDLRVHFGLGSAEKVDILEMHWPSGRIDVLRNLAADQFLVVREGGGFTRIR
jgi:hypothetical protein